MARTIKEINQNIKTSFIGNQTIQEAYGLTPGKTFDELFSAVSVESVLFHIVASSIWLLEKIWDIYRIELEAKVESCYVSSIAWYHHKALEFQLGDSLVFDEHTYSFRYPTIDESRRIVKNVAIRETIINDLTTLQVYFSDADKQPLKEAEKKAFELYMHEVGAAGTHYEFISREPDQLRVGLEIYYDPLVIDRTGTRLKGQGKPVEEAIKTYVNSLEYGGVLYASKLVDMLQTIEGVKDVVLFGMALQDNDGNTSDEDARKLESGSGTFVYKYQEGDITYLTY